jgi:hypothetical protein
MATRTSKATLADALRAWDDTSLRELLELRPDLASPVPADTTQLVSRATTRASLARVLDRLDRFGLAVVEGMAALSDPTTPTELARLLQAPRQQVEHVLSRLHKLAVVWRDGRRWRPVRAVHDVLGPHPAGLGPWARDERLSTPERIDTAIAEAGPAARQVLDRLTWGPPTGRMQSVRRDVDVATATNPVEQLLARGLLIASEPRTVVLPREVGLHLRGGRLTEHPVHEPPALVGADRTAKLVDRTAAGAAFELVRRVELLLDAWATEPPAVLRGGGVGVRDLRAAAALLGVDEHTAALHIELAREARLLDTADDAEADEVWLPTDHFDVWLAQPADQRWLTLVMTWLDTQRAHGLVGRRDDRGRHVNALAPDLERSLAPEIRRLTLRLLAEVTGAPSVEQVVARVAWERPRRVALRDDLATWTLEEAAAVGVTGLDAIATHGRALLGASESAADALRPLLPETVDHVLLQADLTAVAPGPLDSDLAADLALAADVESRGGATVYRFTERSVRRALDAGWTAADLHDFLAARSRTPVPQPLTYLVDDVARRHGRLRVGLAESYLRCDDPAMLASVLADPRAATLRLRKVADTILVTDMPVDLVLDRLRSWGHAPVAESQDGSVAETAARRRRTRSERRRTPRAHEVPVPGAADLDRAVAALRAGDAAAQVRPRQAGVPGSADPSRVLADLRTATEEGASVWLRYVDQHGGLSERVVDPIRVDAGWLTAHDHRADGTRSFAVHRISAVSTVT